MLYLFHGDDEFSRAEAVSRLKAEMDATLGPLNTTVLAGRNLQLGALRAACDTVPFMLPWRLVIVEELLGSATPPGSKASRRPEAASAAERARLAEIVEWLPQAPETTRLVPRNISCCTTGGQRTVRRETIPADPPPTGCRAIGCRRP